VDIESNKTEYPIKLETVLNVNDDVLDEHFHNAFEIIYVQQGLVQYIIEQSTYTIHENSLILINHMEKHRVKILKSPYRRYFMLIKPDYFNVIIDNPILASIFNNRSVNFSHVIELDVNKIDETTAQFDSIYQELQLKNNFWEQAVKLLLYQFIIYLYRNYRYCFPLNNLSESMQIIIDIQKYIDEHLQEPISLEDLSLRYYRNMYYLSHLFRKTTGYTFIDYLCRQRISRAKDLLYHTHASITQVCLDAGFNNVNHFIRIFKKYELLTPYQYRKKFRQIGNG